MTVRVQITVRMENLFAFGGTGQSLNSIFIPGATERNEDLALAQTSLPLLPQSLEELGVEPDVHNFPITGKHVLRLKQDLKTLLRKNLATYWLTLDIHNYSIDFHFLMDNRRAKSLSNKKPFHYQDIIYYDITRTKRSQKQMLK